jgi:hypothetical protein
VYISCDRNLPVPVNPVAVHLLSHEPLELLQERPGALDILGLGLGEWVNQSEIEVPFEELSDEAGRVPVLLASGFSDIASFLLRRQRAPGRNRLGLGGQDVGHCLLPMKASSE